MSTSRGKSTTIPHTYQVMEIVSVDLHAAARIGKANYNAFNLKRNRPDLAEKETGLAYLQNAWNWGELTRKVYRNRTLTGVVIEQDYEPDEGPVYVVDFGALGKVSGFTEEMIQPTGKILTLTVDDIGMTTLPLTTTADLIDTWN